MLPYAPLRSELLSLPTADWVARCNALAACRGLLSAAGAPLSFVAAAPVRGALGYEAEILHHGRIACRPAGRGALHDLHNALVWLTFPQVKATLNRLHLAAVGGIGTMGPVVRAAVASGRGRTRDLATLLDESGLLWVSASSRLDRQLQAGQWRELLVANREQVRAMVLPIVIGHGLLVKLAAPYKAMTAHCLVCPIDRADGGFPGSGFADMNVAAVDAAAAQRLASMFGAEGAPTTAPNLAPLPILGLPGWDPANLDASYYDDARVFRAQRT